MEQPEQVRGVMYVAACAWIRLLYDGRIQKLWAALPILLSHEDHLVSQYKKKDITKILIAFVVRVINFSIKCE